MRTAFSLKLTAYCFFLALPFISFNKIYGSKKIVQGPAGTIWLHDSVFMDATEVRNIDYREYIYWLRKKYSGIEPYIITKALPDTLIWRKEGSYSEELVSDYFSHPEYNDFPVVGVSYQQALDYCKWRTDRVMEYLRNASEKEKKRYNLNNVTDLHFRLPTTSEWEYGASAGLDTSKYFFGYYGLSDTLHDVKVNVKKSYSDVLGMNYSIEPVPVRTGIPNEYGFYNMIGNVAEMTAAKGICKGGSFMNYIEECHIRDSINYIYTFNCLGFRCVCVTKKK